MTPGRVSPHPCVNALLATLLVTLAAAPPRGQVRDRRPDATGTATISGMTVTDEPEPRPVRRVRVTCSGPDFSATAITDDRGRFTFTGLKAGRYSIAGTKDAWVPSAYGAKRPLRPGSAIPIADGETARITLRMLRGSVITGVLFDYNNQPAPSTLVSALRYTMRDGTRQLTAAGTGLTDDRGIYRIFGLAPGDYVVGAAPRPPDYRAPASELRLLDPLGERTVAFAPTYFPGSAFATQAAMVTLGRGEERDGIDFALQLVRTARVDGVVSATDGSAAPAGTSVSLIAHSESMFPGTAFAGLRSTRTAADGTFNFADVRPGAYTVLARGSGSLASISGVAQISWASTDIAIDGDDATGLALGLQPGMVLTGQLSFDATRLTPPGDLKSIHVELQPVQSPGSVSFAPSGKITDNAGHFLIAGIVPGTYRLTAAFPGLGSRNNWYLRSAIVKGEDTADGSVAIRAGESIRGATIVLSDRPAQVSGTVRNTGGPPNDFTVIVFPANQSLWTPLSRRIHASRPSADGAFGFRGLPPGDYLLAAIDDVEPNEWFDPALLQRLLPTAIKIALAEGEEKAQDIRIGGGG